MGALLDKFLTTLVQLDRDQAPDPSESLEGHHLWWRLQLAIVHHWFAVGGR